MLQEGGGSRGQKNSVIIILSTQTASGRSQAPLGQWFSSLSERGEQPGETAKPHIAGPTPRVSAGEIAKPHTAGPTPRVSASLKATVLDVRWIQ